MRCFHAFWLCSGCQMWLDQVKRCPTVYADMPVFYVFAPRALFSPVSAMSQGTGHDALPFLPNMPVFHIVAVQARFPRVSAMPQGHECVRFKLSDPWPFFPDMTFFPRYCYSDDVSMCFGRLLGSQTWPGQVKRRSDVFAWLARFPCFDCSGVVSMRFNCVLGHRTCLGQDKRRPMVFARRDRFFRFRRSDLVSIRFSRVPV
jgi:hypothetical protein